MRWMRPAVVLIMILSVLSGALAEEEHIFIKMKSSLLTYDENGLAYLKFRDRRKTAEGYEYDVRTVLFGGIAFTEGDNWRAELTYKKGILDGEVVVWANNKFLYRFRYEKGVKVVEKRGSFNYLTASPDKFLGQRVTIFISDVTLPERNAGLGDDFKIYLVDTCSSDGTEFALGMVKVSKDKAESFVERYTNKTVQISAKSASGVFRERDFEDNYPVSVPYYIDMTRK